MLSADISGFTALSERLAGKGKAGAEEITELINECFTALIAAATHHGGEIIKFGGDAILVLFRSEDHELRAGAASIDMQVALASLAAARRAKLTMTVGAATGPFDAFLVGSDHRELLIVGPRASRVIGLEGRAEKGQTLVDDAIADALRPHVDPVADGDGWKVSGSIELDAIDPPAIASGTDLHVLVPEAVATHFSGFAELGGEHRLVTTGFLAVAGLDESSDSDPEGVAEALGELVDTLTKVCRQHGVTVLHSDVAPDGAKFVLCAGAPVTLGNTADAMLTAALALARVRTRFDLRLGVQYGRVFAGFLGSAERRTYTLMGDPVNTAARMLGQARPGEVVAVDDVLAATRMVFDGDALPLFTVKGKTEPINATVVYGATEWAQRPRSDAPHIGRTAEREALLGVLHNDTPLMEIVAPAGTGKSRLLEELRFEASRHLHPVVSTRCTPYSAATPYALLQSIVRLAADIDHAADPEIAGELLAKSVRHHDPGLMAMLPVLAIPAGAEVPETDEASAIDPKFLRERIHEETARFLRAALPSGTLLVVEDMHWVDEASSDFLEFALDHPIARHWSMVLSSRPNGNWTLDPDSRTTIELDPLSDDDVRTLVLASVETDLTDRTLDTIMARSAGNPLFAIELAKLVEGGTADALPDTVEQLIATRLDELDPDPRRTLRVASVFGQAFTASDLDAVFEGATTHLESLTEYLEREGEHLEFVHALFREVAYEGLPFAQRQRFHERVGTHLETSTEDRTGIAGLLAEHFSLAREHERAWTYGTVAGRAARAQAATAEAAVALGRAVAAGRTLRSLDKELLAEVALELGEVEFLLGDFNAARVGYDLARKSTSLPHRQAAALGGIGEINERQGRLDLAKRWLTRAQQTLDDAPTTPDVLRARSKIHFLRAGTLHRQGDPQGCIIEGRKALGNAEDADDVAGMASALQRLHLATVFLGRPDRIEYGPRALELFESLGQYERVSGAHNNLGIEHYFNGRWTEAAESYELATEAGVRAGSMVDSMLGQLNSGEILSEQGHWDEALDRLHRARRNWEAGRYPIGLCAAKLYLGTTYDRMGDTENARRNLTEALDDIVSFGFSELEDDARLRLLFFEVDQGMHHADEVVERWTAEQATSAHRARLLRIAATALMREGRLDEARTLLHDELPTVSGIERALVLRLLTHASGAHADPAWSHESEEILATFGVVRLESLPSLG